MNDKEQKLNDSTKRLKALARKRVAQRQVFHFRLEAENIEALYEIAGKEKIPVGTMVRKWVTERLHEENSKKPKRNGDLLNHIEDLDKRLKALERKRKTS
jgi:hypothetical protein